ncbi:MAG: flagellar assembly protein FliX [Geminicoccaceae bacterium]|nr:flagellar assembly protein FliX [Geminicoccaceae bacterium]
MRVEWTVATGAGGRIRRTGRQDGSWPLADLGTSGPVTGPRAGGAAPVGPLAGIDALIALQQVDEASDRRRRTIRHATTLLDLLEELQLGLLAGAVQPGTVRALARGLGEIDRASCEPALARVLAELATRVEVELAKLEVATAAAAASAGGGR